ncbi:hypothetical protein K490DRAFT_65040 [Saccharata proteae CBS 121410]|uniref:ATP synthase F(0) complex subunit e, mitochondrial n=1 Tax=Saccharata proteae CBS 121410 TaxID=1314787 RepID=A0A9P4M0Y7_9PEZI|nr:hypothetical protein K490DRAFT_65040 [Saccharata proteae CBS 121410]
MSASTGVNVLRWSALGLGVLYGVYHQTSISSRDQAAAAHAEFERKQQLVQQAKAEWAKKTAPKDASGIVTDPNDPKFDLEAYLTKAAASN